MLALKDYQNCRIPSIKFVYFYYTKYHNIKLEFGWAFLLYNFVIMFDTFFLGSLLLPLTLNQGLTNDHEGYEGWE